MEVSFLLIFFLKFPKYPQSCLPVYEIAKLWKVHLDSLISENFKLVLDTYLFSFPTMSNYCKLIRITLTHDFNVWKNTVSNCSTSSFCSKHFGGRAKKCFISHQKKLVVTWWNNKNILKNNLKKSNKYFSIVHKKSEFFHFLKDWCRRGWLIWFS